MGAILGVSRGNTEGDLPTTSTLASDEKLKPTENHEPTEQSSISKTTKSVKPKKSKSGNVLSVIEDIQRLPNEAIHQEFDRLLTHTGRHFKKRSEKPCADISEKLQSCLYKNHQRSCRCFQLMEDYRQCVYRATQNKLDTPIEEPKPPLLPAIPSVVLPKQEPTVGQQHIRSRWKFWTWFR